MAFWNVAGLEKMDQDGINFMKQHEIIALEETWMGQKNEKKIQKVFKEYEFKHATAEKDKKKGRAREGILLAVRRGCGMKLIECKIHTKELISAVIEVQGKRILVCAVYMRDCRKENYEII